MANSHPYAIQTTCRLVGESNQMQKKKKKPSIKDDDGTDTTTILQDQLQRR